MMLKNSLIASVLMIFGLLAACGTLVTATSAPAVTNAPTATGASAPTSVPASTSTPAPTATGAPEPTQSVIIPVEPSSNPPATNTSSIAATATTGIGTEVVPTNSPVAGPTSGPLTIQEQLAQIDQTLSQSMKSSFAYNSPSNMKLDDTATIELLLNPSVSSEQLGSQVTEPGTVSSGSINITPRMKAELIAQDPEAFSIRSIPENPVQLISGTETTRWHWLVTARKRGAQTLTLIIYRLVQYQGQDYWREVQTYKADIQVNVTLGQVLGSLDWKWIIGILVTAIAIPAFWRWFDLRKKQSEQNKKKKRNS